MSYMTTLLQVILLFGALGYGAYYMTKKTRKQQFFKQGENGHIQVKDGVFLNHQTSAFLFEVDGKQIFTVVSNNGVQSVQLTGNQFQQALEDAVKSETKKVEDPS
ncbi:flagellar motor switch protein FliN [Bacillus anthracis]|uniref:Flagellar motor switch protein FliN n=1 Tax=Bacillus fungorum TaxID=2039284 RepID=A0A2G6QI51_9BACI|nr:flagellar motor switch protein FliN [Bacillus fungorum]PGK37950.1 flagellar motor switch protein FliN [Bacillus anthracis]PIE96010.1 flagellar motor switch protein FliN [Bacillus fungorum]